VPYLTGVKGFTNEQVMNDIFPVFTYSDFAFVVLAAPASQARSHEALLCALSRAATCGPAVA
jgi:hypothetical protein